MNVRHAIRPAKPLKLIDIRFNEDSNIFTVSTPTGFAIYRTWPLALLRKRDLSNGSLSIIQPMQMTSLLLLVGGGRTPLYPPNKVVFWDDARGHEVAELEFRERVLGVQTRRDWVVVALKRRVITFRLVDGAITRHHEYTTGVNVRGLIGLATSPNSTTLAVPAAQPGLVQLIHLPRCPAPPEPPIQPPPTPYDPPPPLPAARLPPLPPNHPSLTGKTPTAFITAHITSLATLTSSPSGRLLATTSERGTLVRIWDAYSGALIKELRRGMDKAEIYGVAFRPDESEVCVWSDKGTVHVFKITGTSSGTGGGSSKGKEAPEKGNRQSAFQALSPFLRLHKYFASEWSYASYRLPAPTARITLSSAMRGGGERGDGGRRQAKDGEGEIIKDDGDGQSDPEKCVVGWIEVPVPVPVPAGSNAGWGGSGSPGTTPPTSTGVPRKAKAAASAEAEYREQMQYQLVALTYSGCWYRLSVPSSSSTLSGPTFTGASLPGSSSSQAPRSTVTPVSIPGASGGGHVPSSSGSGPASVSGRRSPLSTSPRSPPTAHGMSSTPPKPSPLGTGVVGAPASILSAAAATVTNVGITRPRSSTPTRGIGKGPGAHTLAPLSSITGPTATRERKGKERDVHFTVTSATSGSTSSSSPHAGSSSRARQDSSSASGSGSTDARGKDREKTNRKCILEEFRRFGRWDGW